MFDDALRPTFVSRVSYATLKTLIKINAKTKRFIVASTIVAMIAVRSERYASTARIIMMEMLKRLSEKPVGSTQFQVFNPDAPTNVIDLTRKRLEMLIASSQSAESKKMFEALLTGYVEGRMAVGWSNASKPVFRQTGRI
jgi:hypothetical protein